MSPEFHLSCSVLELCYTPASNAFFTQKMLIVSMITVYFLSIYSAVTPVDIKETTSTSPYQ